jgi:hypothetical protein
MPKKTHPADLAVDFSTATSFIVSLFLGRGKYAKTEVATMQAANECAAMMNAESTNGRLAMIYGRFADGSEKLVTEAAGAPYRAKPAKAKKEPIGRTAKIARLKPAKAAKPVRKWGGMTAKQRAARDVELKADIAKGGKAKANGKAPTSAPAKALGKRATLLADAEAGILPEPPDFSAATHARFRGKLAALVLHAKEGNIAALKAFPINPISSSPKALDRYRNLAVIALAAKGA